MALFVVVIGFFLIYIGIPWLIAAMFRSFFREAGMGLKLRRWASFAIFCLAFWGVWELRSDPSFWFHADQLEKFGVQAADPPIGSCDYRERYCPEIDRRIIEAQARAAADKHQRP